MQGYLYGKISYLEQFYQVKIYDGKIRLRWAAIAVRLLIFVKHMMNDINWDLSVLNIREEPNNAINRCANSEPISQLYKEECQTCDVFIILKDVPSRRFFLYTTEFYRSIIHLPADGGLSATYMTRYPIFNKKHKGLTVRNVSGCLIRLPHVSFHNWEMNSELAHLLMIFIKLFLNNQSTKIANSVAALYPVLIITNVNLPHPPISATSYNILDWVGVLGKEIRL